MARCIGLDKRCIRAARSTIIVEEFDPYAAKNVDLMIWGYIPDGHRGRNLDILLGDFQCLARSAPKMPTYARINRNVTYQRVKELHTKRQ